MPAFGDDKDVIPLQAADLISYWIREEIAKNPGSFVGNEPISADLPWRSTKGLPLNIAMLDHRSIVITVAKMILILRPDLEVYEGDQLVARNKYHFRIS